MGGNSSYFGSLDLVVDRTLSEVDEAAQPTKTDIIQVGQRRSITNDALSGTVPDGSHPGLLPGAAEHGKAESRYTILGEIASGGQAVVLRAIDARTDREVAIKQLRKKGGEVRFVNEALITGRLAHPSIVSLLDVGHWEDGTPYFAMKLIEGSTLADELNRPNSLAERMPLLDAVCRVTEAVSHAHGLGIIHRDIKPSNVLLAGSGETVLIDWGIAKELKPASQRPTPIAVSYALTHSGAILGTPGYMAPEQATDSQPDERADVYAIGAMLYHVLAGVPPYAGLSPSDIILEVQQGHDPTPVSRFVDGISIELLAVVSRAMSRDRDRRFATALELLDALRAALAEQESFL